MCEKKIILVAPYDLFFLFLSPHWGSGGWVSVGRRGDETHARARARACVDECREMGAQGAGRGWGKEGDGGVGGLKKIKINT